mmetsp:Transcript_1184/g.5266  ORF Transcript_1184/g.5266 Transcript_1184/m.5266 type:complete len:229 (-) Transcript_1184:511-1197(-)
MRMSGNITTTTTSGTSRSRRMKPRRDLPGAISTRRRRRSRRSSASATTTATTATTGTGNRRTPNTRVNVDSRISSSEDPTPTRSTRTWVPTGVPTQLCGVSLPSRRQGSSSRAVIPRAGPTQTSPPNQKDGTAPSNSSVPPEQTKPRRSTSSTSSYSPCVTNPTRTSKPSSPPYSPCSASTKWRSGRCERYVKRSAASARWKPSLTPSPKLLKPPWRGATTGEPRRST